jgi:hypothetical protein
MGQELLIREVFRLGGGTTVLACEGAMTSDVLAGRRACLMVDGLVRQSIVLSSERTMLNMTSRVNQRALETLDAVEVLPDEVQGGKCRLVLE